MFVANAMKETITGVRLKEHMIRLIDLAIVLGGLGKVQPNPTVSCFLLLEMLYLESNRDLLPSSIID
jgi:hypothetical protein